jgi:hypothetical protein
MRLNGMNEFYGELFLVRRLGRGIVDVDRHFEVGRRFVLPFYVIFAHGHLPKGQGPYVDAL